MEDNKNNNSQFSQEYRPGQLTGGGSLKDQEKL
jgi:hypothetical protein